MRHGDFLTLAGPGEGTLKVRGSSFHAIAAPIEDEEDARALLAERERGMYDATHHCSAWKLREGLTRANDGGEPSGSAGAPILAAVVGAGLVDCAVVVTRYYGGTNLGVGGLVRAYGEAAALALAAAPRRFGTPAARVRVRYPYAYTAAVMRALDGFEGREVEHGYAPGGTQGQVTFSLAIRRLARFTEGLREDTGAAVAAERLGDCLVYRNEIP